MATNSKKMTTFAADIRFLAVKSRLLYYNNVYGKDNSYFQAYDAKRMETTIHVTSEMASIHEVCLVPPYSIRRFYFH